MKKLISLVLSLALVLSAFCMSVMAAPIVGSRGEKNTIEDGIAEATFNSNSLFESVILNLEGVHSRYAVDVTFPATLTFSSSAFIWNVNTMQYEQQADFSLTDTTFDFVLTNYSDKAVKVEFGITGTTQLEEFGGQILFDEITNISDTWGTDADFTDYSGTTVGFTGYLQGVYAVDANKGSRTPTNINFSAEMTTEDGVEWSDVIGRYMLDNRDNGTTTYTLAKFTITVSKVTTS